MKTSLSILLFGIAGIAILSLAVGAELKHTAPAKTDLSGLWKINPDLSDDAYQAVEKKRQDSTGGGRSSGGPVGRRPSTLPGGIVIDAGDILDGVFGGTTSGSAGGTVGGRRSSGGASDRPADDPEPYSMRAPLDSFLATIDQFEIAQAPDSLKITTVDETSACKPAAPGKAPVPGGELGERKCGWQGDTWVIEITAPNGVIRTNRYELRKSGRQLVLTSEIKGGKSELAGLRIKRVYDRVF